MVGTLKFRGLVLGLTLSLSFVGCATSPYATTTSNPVQKKRSRTVHAKQVRPILRVFTLFYQKPWLNLDAYGDRDPEGLEYRIFLDPGTGRGVLHDGNFVIALYHIDRDAEGHTDRKLVSDWKYATSDFAQIDSKLLGMGYLIRLRWARKDIAGKEIEVITRFEHPDGSLVSAGTKRLRVPKYTS